MGQTCSCVQVVEVPPLNDPESGVGVSGRQGSCPDPLIYDLVRRSSPYHNQKGQHHLLYRKGKSLMDFHSNSGGYHNGYGYGYTYGLGHAHSHLRFDTSHITNKNNTTSTTNTREKDRPRPITVPLTPDSEVKKAAKDLPTTTRLILRRVKPEHSHLPSTTHIYAIRSHDDRRPEQRPTKNGEEGEVIGLSSEQRRSESPVGSEPKQAPVDALAQSTTSAAHTATGVATASTPKAVYTEPDLSVDPYTPKEMAPEPQTSITDWVCVNEELDIHVCDTGLTPTECDHLVSVSEQVCKGHYAAYTYAKQTLGCREFPTLAHACYKTVHRVTHAIWDNVEANRKLQLDDREPHIVKYDVTKKERQKLDMHTDKSEWTFLIALSDGCGLDYEGGGTYFEALDATVHVQRGHALIFPGKLRHCGQRITKGLRFLLVGFLVDKSNPNHNSNLLPSSSSAANAGTTPNNVTTDTADAGVDASANDTQQASMTNEDGTSEEDQKANLKTIEEEDDACKADEPAVSTTLVSAGS